MDSVIRWPSCFLSLALFLVSLSRLAATLQTADRDPASHPRGRGLKHPASETSSIANNLEAVLELFSRKPGDLLSSVIATS